MVAKLKYSAIVLVIFAVAISEYIDMTIGQYTNYQNKYEDEE